MPWPKGRPAAVKSPSTIEKLRQASTGRVVSGETRNKIRESLESTRRKSGFAQTRDSSTRLYVTWRQGVYERDQYTCQDCTKGPLEGKDKAAHHIQSWEDAPDRRFDLSNGVTLCHRCHRRRHSKAFKAGMEIVGAKG